MRMKLKFLLLAGLLGFSACTNELPNPNDSKTDTIRLVQAPEVYVYSGGQMLGTRSVVNNGTMAYGARPESNMWGTGIFEEFPAPDPITEEERQKVLEVFNQKGQESYESLVDWSNFFVQHVWKGTDSYVAGNGGTVVGGNQMDKLVCGSEAMGDDHVSNFNASDGSVMLMFDSSTQRFGYSSSTDNGHILYYFRMEYIDGAYYVGFDFSAEGQNPNEQVKRDYIYNDWIVKIVPGTGVEVTPPSGNIPPVVVPDEPLIPLPGVDVDDPDSSESLDHVEINLSIEERTNAKWLASHLSIHVRAVTDVEVFIPLPARFYCAVDDMAIVQKHEGELLKYGGPESITYNVNGSEITLTVNFEAEGIRVKTNGIDENAISYLQETYGDGLTFEVWNYMNILKKDWNHGLDDEENVNYGSQESIAVGDLREYLNQSTVTFTDAPTWYINAFMYTPGCECIEEHTCDRFIDDCIVKPTNPEFPENGSTGYWYNGSPYNEIYKNS